MDKEIKALLVPVGEEPREIMIANDFRALQKAVGGCIEFYPLSERINIVCNDEGKINGMQGNRLIGNEIICGDFLIVGDDGMGETISLTKEQIDRYSKAFKTPMEFTKEQIEDNLQVKVMTFEEYYRDKNVDTRPKVEPMPYTPKNKSRKKRDKSMER